MVSETQSKHVACIYMYACVREKATVVTKELILLCVTQTGHNGLRYDLIMSDVAYYFSIA